MVAAAASLPIGMRSRTAHAAEDSEWGAVQEDPDQYLDLPPGFTYTFLQVSGETMSDGYRMPDLPDGMACFQGDGGELILMRNHETSGSNGSGAYSAGEAPPEAWDESQFGGVTRLVLQPNGDSYIPKSSNLVLTGTTRNCAGGPTPWGWVSCEETFSSGHGYAFLAPLDAESVVDAEAHRLLALGRYSHEACAFDTVNERFYMTEDRGDSCFYRLLPDIMDIGNAGGPILTGTLQAMKVDDGGGGTVDTDDMEPGDAYSISWVTIDEADPDSDTVRTDAQAAGASRVSRGEGLWMNQETGEIYVVSTNGGPEGGGQIFKVIDDGDSGTIECIAADTGNGEMDSPDNLTVHPNGTVWFVEDGSGNEHIRYIDAQGTVRDFGINAYPRLGWDSNPLPFGSPSELTGVCFSPDGSKMFLNIQEQGITLMIEGPFPTVGGDGDGDGETSNSDVATPMGDGDGTAMAMATATAMAPRAMEAAMLATMVGMATGTATAMAMGTATTPGSASPTRKAVAVPPTSRATAVSRLRSEWRPSPVCAR